MSVLENIQKLFKTKPDQPGGSASTFGMTSEPGAANTTARGRANAAEAQEVTFSPSGMAVEEDSVLVSAELLSLPVLGVRPLAEHQKILVLALVLGAHSRIQCNSLCRHETSVTYNDRLEAHKFSP